MKFRTIIIITLAFFLFIPCYVYANHGAHLVWGKLYYSTSLVPADGVISFTSYITARPSETQTQSSGGCGYSSGYWYVECGNFPSGWNAGESLRVNFTATNGEYGSLNYTITEGSDVAPDKYLTAYVPPPPTPPPAPTPKKTPTPVPTPKKTPTPIPTPSTTPSITPTPSVIPTPSVTPSITPSPTTIPTASPAPTATPTPAATPTPFGYKTPTPPPIDHITIVASMRNSFMEETTTSATVQLGYRAGDNNYWGEEHTLTQSYAFYVSQWNVNSNTGVNWSRESFDDIEIGVLYTSGDGRPEVNQEYLEFWVSEYEYTPTPVGYKTPTPTPVP